MLHGSYDPWLVAASLLMAVMASYTALNMTSRVTSSQGWLARLWLGGGAIALGIGIWSMHFLGMLAFQLPIPVGYDPVLTLISALIAVAASGFALWLVCQSTLSRRRLVVGSFIMGAGVCGMHFTGMAAMRMHPAIQYDPYLLALAVAISVVASGIALGLGFHLRVGPKRAIWVQIAAAMVMGFAISGMHYTAMAAAKFRIGSVSGVADIGVTRMWLAILIILTATSVILIALIVSILDYRLQSRTDVLSSSLLMAQSEIEFFALHDGLTKLPNRLLLEDRLKQEIRQAIRSQSFLSVHVLDLDGFKQVNDAYGHKAGDQVLVEVSRRIQERIRSTDTFARMGGDEFVLVAKVSDAVEAANVAEMVLAAVQEPVSFAGQAMRVSTSIGVALFDGNADKLPDLIKNADTAMYRAKDLGRNGYCIFDDSMYDDLKQKLVQLHDLRSAIERQQLVLYYQPKVHARSRRILGFEALVRWRHSSQGLIPPNEFIPLAEKTGLIIPIGNWVLNEACRQIREWQSCGNTDWHVSVNLSAIQFNHPSLVGTVQETLDRYQLVPASLTLEITESTAMHHVESSMVILKKLSQMGVRISIDDFGTGYSSLLYLKRLPARELKIDRAFVRDLGRDGEDEAIIASILALGRTLNLRTVAEGVETAEQAEFLTNQGCDELQGYFLGVPVPPEEVISQSAGSESMRGCRTPPSARLTHL